MKNLNIKKERHETAGVIIEVWDEGRGGIEIYFKPNEYGKRLREMYRKLCEEGKNEHSKRSARR